MSNNDPSRLDRLEALAETILAGLQETRNGLAETRAITNSNAKSIQALSDQWQKDREQWKKDRDEWRQDRRRVFEWMARLAAAQADFYEVQADSLHHIEKIDDRLAEILERLIPEPDNN